MSMNNTKGVRRPGPVDWGESRTKQSDEAATNINNIVRKYVKTGELSHISKEMMQYRDISGTPDLHTAMVIVANANTAFQELPAAIRKRVGHDAGNFLPFIDDPENFEECLELGLLEEADRPEAISVPTPPIPPEIPPEEPPEDGGE